MPSSRGPRPVSSTLNSETERRVVLVGLKTEDAEIQHRFFLAGLLSWVGFSICVMAIIAWGVMFFDDEPNPFNPFLVISLPGMALSAVSIWLSKATARKAVKWRRARNDFWDAYGYRPGDF